MKDTKKILGCNYHVMSSLSYICDYGSSDESDKEEELTTKKAKLPAPDLSKVQVVSTEKHLDDPNVHGGRERLFPHARGNWATFVYISYFDLSELVNKIHFAVCALNNSCHICEDFHISLSHTFVLKYHQITSFTTSLKRSLEETERSDLCFESVKVYCNENKSRTFVSLGVDFFTCQYLKKIVGKIDKVLLEYKLPVYYDEPSFHMSLLWFNGDKKKEIETIAEDLNEIVLQFFESNHTVQHFGISKVNCKSGNKIFQFNLV